MKQNIKTKLFNHHSGQAESGRSMVEMLGVLAIIGVISIGAIAGYRYAMEQHQYNEIIKTVGLMAVSISNQLEATNEYGIEEFDDNIMGYPVSVKDYCGSNTSADPTACFSIILDNVPDSLGQKFLKNDWDIPLFIGDVLAGISERGYRGKIYFAFVDTLDSGNHAKSCVQQCAQEGKLVKRYDRRGMASTHTVRETCTCK